MENFCNDSEIKFNNSFWNKSYVLFNHAKQKVAELNHFYSLVDKFSKLCIEFGEKIGEIEGLRNFKKMEDSTCSEGIEAFILHIKRYATNLVGLGEFISEKIIPLNDIIFTYNKNGKDNIQNLGISLNNKYQEALNELKRKKEEYEFYVNDAILALLNNKLNYNSKLKVFRMR